MPPLGQQLFDEVRPEFFRVLSGRLAAVFVDLAEALESALESAPDGVVIEDTIAIAQDVLERRPLQPIEVSIENLDEPGGPRLAELPRVLIRRLIETGWLEKPRRSDFREIVFLDPHAKILLGALKRIARPGDAVFTDPLEMVAKALVSPDGFRENPWGALQACLASAAKGVEDLEQMSKAVARLTRRQVQSESLGENLARVFEEFSRKFAQSCYRELIRTRLHTRMPELLGRLETLAQDEPILLRMREELLRRQPELSPTDAAREVRRALDRLRDQLSAIPLLADRVDQHTAEFARRSLARFRYLQEIGSRRREALQGYFELVKSAARGRRLTRMEDPFSFPPLEILNMRLFGGADSLFPPRRPRSAVPPQPVEASANDAEADETLAEIQRNLRDSLSVHRANRFVEALPGGPGTRFSLPQLPLRTPDDVEDLVAVLLHAGSRDARYQLIVPRIDQDGHAPEFFEVIGYRVERVELLKTTDPKPPNDHGQRSV